MLSNLTKTFVAIVETGSITRAAEELSLAKSAVSQNLKRLEQQLGITLATRSTRRLALTPAGNRYYQRCKELIVISQRAEAEMESFGTIPSGPMKITAPHAFIGPVISPAMATLCSRFPGLSLTVVADDKRLDLIEQGIDMAITVGVLKDSNLRAKRVGILQDILCISPTLMVDAPSTDDPTFIGWARSLPYIAHVRESKAVEHTLTSSNNSSQIHIRFQSTLRCNTIDGAAAFAREGLGVVLLPNISAAEDLISGRLVRLCGSFNLEPKPIYAVHAYDRLPPKSINAAIEAVQDTLTKLPP